MAQTTIEILDEAGLVCHVEALSDLLVLCVHDGASVSFILPFDAGHARSFWLGKVAPGVAAGTRILLAAMTSGHPVGTVQLDLDTPPNQAHHGEVAKLLVHPEHRRTGMAKALMQRIEHHARTAGRSLLTLDTAGEAAERLYLSLGYERAGTIPGYAKSPLSETFEATTYMFKSLE